MRLWRGGTIVLLGLMTISSCTRQEVKSPLSLRKIKSAIYEEVSLFLPLDVVLVIDQSGSMTRVTDREGLRMEVAKTFVDFLSSWAVVGQDHRVGVVNFGTYAPPEKSIPITAVRLQYEQIKQRLSEQKAEFSQRHLGHTMFVRALKEAVRLLEDSNAFQSNRRSAIIILTDGRPDDGTGGPLEPYFKEIANYVNQELLPHQVYLYVVAIDRTNTYWPSNKLYWESICTSRRTFQVQSIAEAEQVYLEIIADLLGLDWQQVKTQTVNVPPYLERVSFTLLKLSPEVRLRVLDPGGKEITPKVPGVFYRTDEKGIRYEIYSIPDPEPGTWTVEPVVQSGQSFLGKVTVLMHSLFVTTIVHSPKNPHPLKMPMRFEVEFRRRDGKSIQENPKYPLAIYAKVWLPKAKRPYEVSFRREGHIFLGKSEIPTNIEGDYEVDLMVKGGGELIFHRQEKITVKPLPYLKIGDPEIPWHSSVRIQATLMQEGKPQRVDQVFHPSESAESIGMFRILRGSEQKEVLIGYLEPQNEPIGTILTCTLPPVTTVQETLSQMISNLVRLRWGNVFRIKPQRTIDQVELRLIGKLLNGEEYRSQVFKLVYERVNRLGMAIPWTIVLILALLLLRWWVVVGPAGARPFGELVLGNQGTIILGRGRYKKRVLTIGSRGDIRLAGERIRPIEGRIFVKKRKRPGRRGVERFCMFQSTAANGGKVRLSRFFGALSVVGLLTNITTVGMVEMQRWSWLVWQTSIATVVVCVLIGWLIKKAEDARFFSRGSEMGSGWTQTIGSVLVQYRS